MKIVLTPEYEPRKEKEYCCVPAVLQMVQQRRNIPYTTQDEIGYQLGLIVPKDKAHLFSKIRIGKIPKGGWGTETSKKQYSINNYFSLLKIPLQLRKYRIDKSKDLSEFIVKNFKNNNDIIVCYNSQVLFHSGDEEHVSLIESIDTNMEELIIIDPAIGVPNKRKASITHLIEACYSQETKNSYGIWVISSISKSRT